MKVTARGAGFAILQMSVTYNVDIPRFLTPPPLHAFELLSHQHYYGRNQSHIMFQACARSVRLRPLLISMTTPPIIDGYANLCYTHDLVFYDARQRGAGSSYNIVL